MGSKDTTMETTRAAVVLIPWDPDNAAQNQRMVDQRVACTWGSGEVEGWRSTVRKGTKLMYWIALGDETPNKEKMMGDHFKLFPKEQEPLTDTATQIGNAPVAPTNTSFIPIGHIAMEHLPGLNAEFSLPPSTYWVKSFYISWALQSTGLGRKAMHQVERAAASPPFNCTAIALDTVTGVYQGSEESLRGFYEDRGIPRPKVIRTNQEWYQRQGYEIIAMKEAMYDWTHPGTGVVFHIPGVYLKKELV